MVMKLPVIWRYGVLQLLCFLLLMGGCVANVSQPSATTTPPASQSASELITTLPVTIFPRSTVTIDNNLPLRIENDDIATFSDPLLGIMLDFPKNWRFVLRSDPHSSMSHFFSPCQNPAPEIFPPCSKIQTSWIDEIYANVEELQVHIANETHLYPLISREVNEMLIGNTPIVWVQDEDNMDGNIRKTLRVYILREKGTVLINGYGNLAPVAEIVNTIRFLETP